MKILFHVGALSKDGDIITFKSRRYEVLNIDDVTDVMTKVAIDIETQVENAQLSKSNLVVEKINKVTGAVIIKTKHVSTLKMKVKSVSNIVFNALFWKSMRKTIRIE